MFQEIGVGFLTVRHTHKIIDQAFSGTFERLKSSNAATLHVHHEHTRQSFNGAAIFPRLKQVLSWSSLREPPKFPRPIKPYIQFWYFFNPKGLEE